MTKPRFTVRWVTDPDVEEATVYIVRNNRGGKPTAKLLLGAISQDDHEAMQNVVRAIVLLNQALRK